MNYFKGLEIKKISINTFFQLIVRLTSSSSTLIVTLLIGYFANFSVLGSFTKIVAFVSFFYLVVDFGMNSIFLKTYFKNVKKQLGNLFLLRIILSVLSVVLAIIVAHFLPYNPLFNTGFSQTEKYAIYIFSLSIITNGIFWTCQALLQKKLEYKYSFLPSFISEIFLIILVFAFLSKNSINLLLFAYLISSIIQAFLMFYFLKAKYSLSLSVLRFKNFSKDILVTSYPIGLMLIFNLLYAKVDTIILSIYHSNTDVGIYGISYRFFEVAIAFPSFLSNSVYPLLLKEVNRQKYFSLFKKYSSFFALISIISTLVLFFLSPLLNILKSDFRLSVAPLQILSLSLPFFFLTSIYQWHFVISGKTKFLIPLYFGALVLNIILNVLFIPKYSYYAAAFSTVLCEGLVFIVMLWYFRKTKKNLK